MSSTQDFRPLLPRTYGAFFGRYRSLTHIQELAIRPVLEGRDTVIVAEAASGKTEAALAPVMERLLSLPPEERKGTVVALYVVPTKALVNDIELRMRGVLKALGVRLTGRTGDRPKRPAGDDVCLVTTPESLDSLLCRMPHLFHGARFVVVDEAHLVFGGYRGDHLACLVRRLSRWFCRVKPQFVAMSATLASPEELGKLLFGVDATVVASEQRRPLRLVDSSSVEDALHRARRMGLYKGMVFCNSRASVELTAREVRRVSKWPADRVVVHHASVSKREREDVERAFKRWKASIMVCTSTMELGVDVGDVDFVVLYGAPACLESFYQRVGRGCRRKQGLVAFCVPEFDFDNQRFGTIRKALSQGIWPFNPAPRDISVAVQQTFSMLYSRPAGVDVRDILDILTDLYDEGSVLEVLRHLIDEGLVHQRGPRLLASERVMDMGERGLLHSNIPDEPTLKVVDITTSRTMGEVALSGRSGVLALGGRTWKVVSREQGVIYASPIPDTLTGETAGFARHGAVGAFARFLPKGLR